MNIFWFSFSISLQNIRKKGTSWILSNISLKKQVHRYLQNTIFNFKLKFHLEDGLVEQRYFELFFSAWSIFSSYKRSAPNETDFNIFVHLLWFWSNILHQCHPIFFCAKYGSWPTQKVQQISLGEFIGWETEVYFCHFLDPFYPSVPLNQ